MKNKLLYVFTIVFCIGISSFITFNIAEYKFLKIDKESNKTITEVNIIEENTIKSSIAKVNNAVVFVETFYNSRAISSGTGFVYKVDDQFGYILTCNHVIEDANLVIITNNNEQEAEATILGSDVYADIAVLRVDKNIVLDVVKTGNSSKLEIGDNLFAIGTPVGKSYMGTVTKGILSGKDRTVSVNLSNGTYVMDVLQTDAAINPGNSGGPLANMNGEVVGIVSSKLVKDTVEGMGFAIPIEIAMAATEQLEKGEPMLRPAIGVELIDATSLYNLYLNNIHIDSSVKYGAVIIDIEEGYPASKVGLQRGDVIIAINDIKIQNTSYYRYILCKYNINDTIKVTIMRDKEKIDFDLKLDKSM